jgi:16S rRNA (cytosine967-C5)-methyltransferase
MGARPALTSIDLEEFKVRVASERLARAGLSDRCRCLAFDARLLASDRLPDALARTFETVFVDAPCSGSGTLRRHPEIAWSLEEGAVRERGALPALQLDILSAAAARVAPGGLLFYSTCSNLAPENEGVVSRFLASDAGAGFSAEPVDLAGVAPTLDDGARALLASVQTEDGFLRSAGASADGVLLDGHFLARLRRR